MTVEKVVIIGSGPAGWATTQLPTAPRRSVAVSPSSSSCETRLAALRASCSVGASVMPVPSSFEATCPVRAARQRI